MFGAISLEGLRRGGVRAMIKRGKASRKKPSDCEACGDPCSTGKLLVFDHEHRTGRFRGWLCNGCNLALGLCKDDPDRLRLLAVYQEKFLAESKQAAAKSPPKVLGFTPRDSSKRIFGRIASITSATVICEDDLEEVAIGRSEFSVISKVDDRCDFILSSSVARQVRWLFTFEEAKERMIRYWGKNANVRELIADSRYRIKIVVEEEQPPAEYRKYLTAC